MCGFAGFLNYSTFNPISSKSFLEEMGKAIVHRGPDGKGTWIDKNQIIGLTHRRLSIQDLSETGHQPMISTSKKLVIVFNGEIYNHLNIRKILKDNYNFVSWRGTSDTETLIQSIEILGLEPTLKLIVGMFAFALWNNSENELILARDRMGEKPLYYGNSKNTHFFCSDIKSLKAHPDFIPKIRKESVNSIILHNYIPAPYSIYEDIFKLDPGTYMKIGNNKPIFFKKYWSVKKNGISNQKLFNKKSSQSLLLNELENQIDNSVNEQLISDVPIGAFLSGGIDSSTVVAMMQKNSINRVKTFSIGFKDNLYDESVNASKIAKHLNTDHTNMIIDSRDLEGLLDNLSNYYSEPFADSSQIPTLLVSKLAKNNVSVALSGDGGDELFAGYNRYLFTKKLWSIKSKIPNILNQTSAKILENINEKYFDFFLKKITSINNIGDKIHKGANLLKSDTIEELYLSLILHCKEPKKLLNSFSNDLNSDYLKKFNDVDTTKSSIEKLMYVDQITYLPDDILVKLDRASMAFSLETRVPLLNHKIVELSWQFPETLKIINGHTKWPLREILYKYVPKKFLEGPKKGFGIPLDQWIRSDLKDLINDVINTKTDLTENYLNKNYVNKILNEHHSKSKNWQYLIWNIFISQKWFIDNT